MQEPSFSCRNVEANLGVLVKEQNGAIVEQSIREETEVRSRLSKLYRAASPCPMRGADRVTLISVYLLTCALYF